MTISLTYQFSNTKRELEKLISDAEGYEDYIDYRGSKRYEETMNELINEASSLVSRGETELAVDIILAIIDEIPDLIFDEYDGTVDDVFDNATKVIKDILENSNAITDNHVLKKIFDYVVKSIKENRFSYNGFDIDNWLSYFIQKKLFLDECEDTLLSIIKEGNYGKQKFIHYLLDLYEILNDKVKFDELIQKNLDISSIFERYVSKLREEKEDRELINTLIDYRKEYKDYGRYISDVLLEIYESLPMHHEYQEELYSSFYEYRKYEFAIFKKIKALYNDREWKEELPKILPKIDANDYRAFDCLSQIYIEKDMIDAIFTLVSKKEFDIIIRYESYLLPKYERELVSIYIEQCKYFVENVSDRKSYHQLASNLRHIKEINGGELEVMMLVNDIRSKYRNKRALIDELSRV